MEFDGVRYPKDPIKLNYSEKKYLDQFRDLKVFYNECNGESLSKSFIGYLDVKCFYPIQVNDLRVQIV